MSDALQWVIVSAAVVAAVVYLYRRLLRPRSPGGCSGCTACPAGQVDSAQCTVDRERL